MNSFKSTCVVLVLAGVLYGVYVTLHAPPNTSQVNSAGKPGNDTASVQPPTIDFGPAASAPSLASQPSFGPPPISTPAVTVPAVVPADAASPHATASYSVPDQGPTVETPVLVTPTAPAVAELPTTPPPAEAPANTATDSPLASPATPSPKLEAYKLKMALQAAEQHVKDGKFREALAVLSPLANNSNLAPDQRKLLFSWLDALAAKVIYSREHHVAPPHRVQGRTETLYEVAAKYKVDSQLLQNINAHVVSDPIVLVPGTDLKVIPGPFRAEVNLNTGELTLYAGPLYAGRFTFTVGEDQPKPGTYQVHDKRRDRVYYGRDGRQVAATDPTNPYGGVWIDLGSEVSLHGSPLNSQGATLGCLSFSPQDANDLFAILSRDSEVVIKR